MATDARARTRTHTHTHTHTHTRTHAHTHARADTQTSMATLLQCEFTRKRECDVKVHLTDHKNGDETCSELSDLDENRSSQRGKTHAAATAAAATTSTTMNTASVLGVQTQLHCD